jgi:hypothetical protein
MLLNQEKHKNNRSRKPTSEPRIDTNYPREIEKKD